LLSAGQFAVSAQLPDPLSIVTVVPEIEHTPTDPASTVITGLVEAFVEAVTLNVAPNDQAAGAVKLTVELIFFAVVVWLRVAPL